MNVTFKKTCQIRNNMVKSSIIKGSPTYKRAKFMCMLNIKGRQYFNLPFRQHIEDIEQTLIDYDIKDEDIFSSVWVANTNIPFKRRIEIFGRDIVRLSYGFSRTNVIYNTVKSKGDDNFKKKSSKILTLHLAQRIANVNFAINNYDHKVFDMYVQSYPDFKKMKNGCKEHEKMWKYLDLCLEEAGSINNLFFYH